MGVSSYRLYTIARHGVLTMKNPHIIFQHIVFIGYLAASSTVFAGGVEAQSFKDCESCPVMVSITAGTFEMGSNPSETTAAGVKPERASAEWPKHPCSADPPRGGHRNTPAPSDTSPHRSSD